jgi:predicted ATP-grasp superfamily ATP-dependent carboligase
MVVAPDSPLVPGPRDERAPCAVGPGSDRRYGGRVEHVRWISRPDLEGPVLIAAFEGWNDAGDAASTAARYLVERWEAERVAEIDPEDFYDFTVTRPQVQHDEEGVREIVWPATDVFAATLPGDLGHAVILIGTEPQLRWRTFCRQVVDIAEAVGARLVVVLGALLAEVPHSRPVPVVGTAYDAGVVADLGLRASTYEGPTGIVGVLHSACRDAGLASASLWATVPSYVPGAPSPKAALALIERTASLVGTWVPATDLEIAAAAYERQVSELVDADEETSTYVSSLEQRHDLGDADVADDIAPDEPPLTDDGSLVEEVERFLRNRGDE